MLRLLALVLALDACAFDAIGPGAKAPVHCSNGKTDVGESDIDCGGECGGCGLNHKCRTSSDCRGLACGNGLCGGCVPQSGTGCTGQCAANVTDSCGITRDCAPDGMTYIHGDTFTMGEDSLAGEDVRPAHPVRLHDYCLDLTEVTAGAYASCETCTAAMNDVRHAEFCVTANDDPQLPMNCVAWIEAKAYCEAKGHVLPTSAQWEFAARGTDGRTFAWGNDIPSVARAPQMNACDEACSTLLATKGEVTLPLFAGDDDGYPRLAPVKSYPDSRSAKGLYDMAGNVSEWVADYWAEYQGSNVPVDDPVASTPNALGERVVREGAWSQGDIKEHYAFWRAARAETVATYATGFRCAHPAK